MGHKRNLAQGRKKSPNTPPSSNCTDFRSGITTGGHQENEDTLIVECRPQRFGCRSACRVRVTFNMTSFGSMTSPPRATIVCLLSASSTRCTVSPVSQTANAMPASARHTRIVQSTEPETTSSPSVDHTQLVTCSQQASYSNLHLSRSSTRRLATANRSRVSIGVTKIFGEGMVDPVKFTSNTV